jgi:hypothetical protein
MNQFARLDMPNFNETGLERQDVRVIQRESLRCSFPSNLPIRSGTPSVAINEETKVRVVEEELAVEPLNVDGFDIFFARNKVERCVGLVEQRLSLGGFQRDDLETSSAANAEC